MEIKSLMDQLEQLNIKVRRPSRSASPTHSTAPTDLLSTVSFGAGELTSSEAGSPLPDPEHVTRPDVLDWIAKARESIDAFGGYISMGGPQATKGDLGEDMDEDEGASSAEGGEDRFTFAFEGDDESGGEHADASREASEDEGTGTGTGTGTARRSRFLGDSLEGTERPRRHGYSGKNKLATLPSESAPFGLMAGLALRATKSQRQGRTPSRPQSEASADEGEGVGLVKSDYFLPSGFLCSLLSFYWVADGSVDGLLDM